MDLEPLYELIREFEGLRLKPYLCPAGVLTVGYGTTGEGVVAGVSWTLEQCEDRMKRDVNKFVLGTIGLCPVLANPGNEQRLCAVADFAYNCGLGNLKSSTLRKRINNEDWAGARIEINKWTKGGGKELPGLVRRRFAEGSLLE
jgi:lysozyme